MDELKTSYVVCLENSGYPASLELRKVYQRLSDPSAEADGFLRIVDESGESYLYPSGFFAAIQLPSAVKRSFTQASTPNS